jgi:predicted nucleic acid-binding protein
MAVLLDTGILLRLWDITDPQQQAISASLRLLYRRGVELVTTAQNIAEFWNVSTRPSSARGGYGRSIEETDRRVQFFERYGRILPDNDSTYVEWRRLVKQYRVSGASVHDARIVAQMIAWGLREILTLNPDDFRRYTEISILTPTAVQTSGEV